MNKTCNIDVPSMNESYGLKKIAFLKYDCGKNCFLKKKIWVIFCRLQIRLWATKTIIDVSKSIEMIGRKYVPDLYHICHI